MRPLPIILVLSLAANAGLALAWRAASVPEKTSRQITTTARPPKTASASKDFDAARLADAFKTNNYAEIFAQLRALGVDDMSARTTTASMIWSKYYKRQNELLAGKNNNGIPFWDSTGKTSSKSSSKSSSKTPSTPLTAAERKELRDLASKARRDELAVFGTTNIYGGLEAESSRYNFLPAEKVAQLEDLQRDYAEMNEEISQESARFKLPSDSKQRQVLHDEFRKDLASILTPEELAAYDQRFSSTALTLQRNLSNINISDEEYAALYDAVQSGGKKQNTDIIKEILGDDRYAAYQRENSSAYKTLLAAADRFNIPTSTVDNVYNLRDTASSESQRIASDDSLSPAEKKQALQNLADDTRNQVRAQLGDDVGDAYLKSSGMSWLRSMDAGSSVEFLPGGSTRTRNVAPTPSSHSSKSKSKSKRSSSGSTPQ